MSGSRGAYLALCLCLFGVVTAQAAVPSGFEEVRIATGLASPTAMAFAPDGRLFVCEKAGRLRVIKNGALLSTPFTTIPVQADQEQGLLGIAFDPNFATNRFLYVYYTVPASAADGGRYNRLSRYRASAGNPDLAEPGSETYLIANVGLPSGYHNGGVLHFGTDGMLYAGIGDHLNGSNAQSLGLLGGKILRLNPAAYPDIIPPDNPFVGRPGARGEVWAYGLRNPYTFGVDPPTGRIFINDVGEGAREEINLGARGANFGWPTCEGPCSPPNAGLTDPIFFYTHASGCAITGGTFYRGVQFPSEYNGDYLFADYCGDTVQRLRPDLTAAAFASGYGAPVDLQVAPDGTLHVLEFGAGAVTRVRYVGTGVNRPPVISASGSPTSGLIPLQVAFNAVASDPDGDALSYTWDFGDASAAGSGASPTHTYASSGTYTARVTVVDGRGGTAASTVEISAGNNPPDAAITAPSAGTLYQGGVTIAFRGTATDSEDGLLPASAFSWTVERLHHDHAHPFLGPIGGGSRRRRKTIGDLDRSSPARAAPRSCAASSRTKT